MDATIRRLARYASEADFDRLPREAVHECRRRLIDSIACAAAAYPEPFCGRIRSFAEHYAGTPYFDFGISTEQNGSYLNLKLLENKESFGARAVIYDFYELTV